MGKSTHNNVLDAALNYVKTNGSRLCVCSTEPTTYAEATSTNMLALGTIDSDDYTGPADDTSGRKLTVNEQASITISNTGNAQHVAIADSEAGLLVVTTCTLQALSAGNYVTVPAWEIAIADPT